MPKVWVRAGRAASLHLHFLQPAARLISVRATTASLLDRLDAERHVFHRRLDAQLPVA
jgi:hypothetical protein